MKTEKIKNILGVIVAFANAVLVLDKLIEKYGPEAKKALVAVVDACKKVKEIDLKDEDFKKLA